MRTHVTALFALIPSLALAVPLVISQQGRLLDGAEKPRLRLLSTPFALRSGDIELLAGHEPSYFADAASVTRVSF